MCQEFRKDCMERLLQLSPSNSDGESQLVVVIGFFALALLCYLAKPCPVPEAAVRRRRRLFVRRNRRRGNVNIDPTIRKDQIKRSLTTQLVVAMEGTTLKLAPVENEDANNDNAPGITRSRSKSPTGRNQICCSICLESYAIGDRVAWDRHDHTCLHVFHEECITEWLMTHNDCPSCRLNLIKAEEEDEETGSVTSSSSSAFEVVDGLICKVHLDTPLEITGPS